MVSNESLKAFAKDIRIATLKCLRNRGFGHLGGSLSAVETLAVLYGKTMKYDPKDPRWEGRDYFIMSKGHAGPAVFATLALRGFFPIDMLDTLCEPRTLLPSHCDRLKTPGIDATSGSLGQGLSIAAGVAKGFKLSGKDNIAYCMLGDGECAEGQVWEAAQFIAHNKLDNVVAFVDWNKKQVDGYLSEISDQGDFAAKFAAFGWYTLTVKGNDIDEIVSGLEKAAQEHGDKPVVIILDTVKGYGVPEYEEMYDNHFVNLDLEQADRIIAGLEN